MLKFAAAHGFRNIQNLVQKMKRGRSSYHYVEVMACPSGDLFEVCRYKGTHSIVMVVNKPKLVSHP